MPPLLLLVLVAVIVVVASVAGVFLRRRSRRAAEARIAAASNPVPMLSEDDIAWRIGVLGTERPGLLSAYFEDAETQAEAAAADEVGTPLPAMLQGPPSVPPLRLAPPTPSPVVPTAAVAASVKTKPKSTAQPNPPASRRYRLWRDSAMVLLGAVLLVLFVSTVVPELRRRAAPIQGRPRDVGGHRGRHRRGADGTVLRRPGGHGRAGPDRAADLGAHDRRRRPRPRPRPRRPSRPRGRRASRSRRARRPVRRRGRRPGRHRNPRPGPRRSPRPSRPRSRRPSRRRTRSSRAAPRASRPAVPSTSPAPRPGSSRSTPGRSRALERRRARSPTATFGTDPSYVVRLVVTGPGGSDSVTKTISQCP